jgi:hypothetical protein
MNEVKIDMLENGNLRISVPASLRRSNKNNYIITPAALDGSEPDTPPPENSPLARAIVEGHRYYRMIENGEVKNALEISRRTGIDRSQVGRLIRLVNLAPDIIQRIFEGNIPPSLTINKLKSSIPDNWEEQRSVLLNQPKET